jgi:hypothetical protein
MIKLRAILFDSGYGSYESVKMKNAFSLFMGQACKKSLTKQVSIVAENIPNALSYRKLCCTNGWLLNVLL